MCEGIWHKDGIIESATDEDGWLHTGDIGRWRRNGTLEIVERMSSTIRLSTASSRIRKADPEVCILPTDPQQRRLFCVQDDGRQKTAAHGSEEVLPMCQGWPLCSSVQKRQRVPSLWKERPLPSIVLPQSSPTISNIAEDDNKDNVPEEEEEVCWS